MMTGSQKGLPLKVPTIPIKVVTPNASQVWKYVEGLVWDHILGHVLLNEIHVHSTLVV